MLVKIENNQPITYSVGQLRKENPNTSFPKNIPEATLNSYGVFTVQELPRPDYDPMTHKLVQQQVSGSGTAWSRGWDVVALSQEELDAKANAKMDEYKAAVQNLLDSTAKEKGYDSIISMCSYKGSTKAKWNDEAVVAMQWRDDCWNESLVQMGNYIATGVAPTMDDFLAAMPTPNWPA